MSFGALLQFAVAAWLPGAVLFRMPLGDRARRAALPAEERLFWAVVLSVSLSLALVIALAWAGEYSLRRLLLADAALAAALAAAARFRLRMGPSARRPGASALVPLALVVLGAWQFSAPSEYVIGGKDPGVYINEGIQIAQRGTLVYRDPVVASVPPPARALFFPSHGRTDYYGIRFMGFFISDPDTGAVVGQFPHLFPASVAVAYGLRGLSGAREAVGFWATLGLLAVYFLARRVVGLPAAAAAATLLGLHVLQVWFGRYPNAEVVMQALLFAALLATIRAHEEGDAFFAPVAGALLGLLLFLRVDAVFAAAGVAAALLLAAAAGHRIQWRLPAAFAVAALAAVPYYAGPLRAYAYLPIVFITHLRWWHYAALAAVALAVPAGVVLARARPRMTERVSAWLPTVLAGGLVAAAAYALFLRHPAGKLASYDAYALRIFTNSYATVPALAAALIGYVTTARRVFWTAPALFTTVALFACFTFYKIRIVPEHFWMGRRFVAVILPGLLIFAAAAASWGLRRSGTRRLVSVAIGATFLVLLGSAYHRASEPVRRHVEYAGIIPELERLAAQVGDDALLLVESRDAGSDAHVMALPLAYIYARNVLVLSSVRPDRQAFAEFLSWARTRYRRVYFLGGGGTELLSDRWGAVSVASHRFQVPEFETSFTHVPRAVQRKEFDFGLYELLEGAPPDRDAFDLDVGIRDDLHVVRFHAKEEADGRTMRWSQRQSFVTVPSVGPGRREVVLVMSSGGRPSSAPPAVVEVYLNEDRLGAIEVTDGFREYSLPLPAGVAVAAAASGEPPRLRLVTAVWNPHEVLGTPDDRELGVMVDRVQVR